MDNVTGPAASTCAFTMARPMTEPNLCGAKQKAATSSTGNAIQFPFAGIKKKPKEEWSCALCRESATSERGLNEHLQSKMHKAKIAQLRAKNKRLQGKKHKVKIAGLRAQNKHLQGKKQKVKIAVLSSHEKHQEAEEEKVKIAGLRSQNMANNSSTEPPLKEVSNQENVERQSHQVDKSIIFLHQNVKDRKHVENRSDELPVQRTQHAETLKNMSRKVRVKTKGSTMEIRKKKFKLWCEMCQVGADCEGKMEAHRKGKKHVAQLHELRKKKSKFWCDMCQVGADHEVVMKTHKRGKKHVARLQELGQNSDSILRTATTGIVSLEDDEKVKFSSKPSGKLAEQKSQYTENSENKTGEAAVHGDERALAFGKKKFKYWCEICQVGAESEVTKQAHVKGKKHVARLLELRKKKSKFWCEMCQVGADTELVMEAHKKGKKHIARFQELSQKW